MLDQFTNPGISSSDEGPSETGTDFASDSDAEASSGQEKLTKTRAPETMNAVSSSRLVLILEESWRRVARVAAFRASSKPLEVSPASDPKLTSNSESPAPLAPRVQPVWDLDVNSCTGCSSISSVSGGAMLALLSSDASSGASTVLMQPRVCSDRDYCEPECDWVPLGAHHPNCSQYCSR